MRLVALGAVLACAACASPNAQMASTTPRSAGHVMQRDGREPIGTTVVLTTVGAGLTTVGASMLVCAGGGLGCFSGASIPTWAHGPKIEQVVLATSGAAVFAAGAAALIMVPMWLAIAGSDK